MSEELQRVYSADNLELPKKIREDIDRVSKEKKLSSDQKKKLIEAVKREYINSCFEPGEAIGIISAQSISEPATQMCLAHNERIIIKSNNEVKIARIGGLVDDAFDTFGYKEIDGYEVCDLPRNNQVFVLSLNQEEKLEWRRVLAYNRHISPKRLIRIRTKSGRKIVATDFHSFVTRKNNRIIPISGKELKVGDRIPVVRYLPENCNTYLTIGNLFPVKFQNTFIKKDGLISSPHGLVSLPETINLDSSFGWFIGAYLSEGHSSHSEVCISNVNEDYLSNVRKFTQNLNLNYKEFIHHRGFAWSHDFKIRSTLLSQFIIHVCGTGSRNRRVPEFAYSAPEQFVSGLLRGYFDGDGSVSVSKKMIRAHSNSEELIDGIKLLLTRFGIFAYKHKENKHYYLLIPYKYAPIFLSKIGSDIEEKRKRLEQLSKLAKKFWKDKSYDFTDMIGGFGNILYRIAKKLKYPTRYVNNFTKRQKIGRTTLYRYIKLFERLAKEKNVDIGKEIQLLKRMFNSDVVWDEIVDIHYVDYEKEYVYDLSVDGLETFTTFDGVVTHNTMRTFHFAGSAGVQVTLGLPRLIEIFDARKEPTTPIMTIYLKEKYNNKKESERIAKEIKEKRLKNFVETISLDLTNKKIRIKLKKMKKSTKKEIVDVLREKFKNYKIKTRERTIDIEPEEEELTIKDLQRIKNKLLELMVSGIPKVKNAIVVKEGNDWVIKTLGSNFGKILTLEEVDFKRCHTNNIHEIAEVLGIEAARSALIKETSETMQQQGLNIDDRHIILLADIMTFTGEISAVGRYGVAGMKTSVLTRAGFEETIKHLVRASVRNETDDFNGLFENVMVNQQVPVGTGMFDLIARMGKE